MSSPTPSAYPDTHGTPLITSKIAAHAAAGRPFFSLEYFPPKTAAGVAALTRRAAALADLGPLFVDVTWGAGGSSADVTLDIADALQNHVGVDVLMHLTCTNMPREKVDVGLEGAKARGVRNILALRGDPPAGQEWQACEGGFECARDLVEYIRREHGDFFCIGVAGYPEGHPAGFLDDKCSFDDEIAYLKSKIDAGGEFIVTQMFFDVDLFLKFVAACRAAGISVPILPGILPITTIPGFEKMTAFCKSHIPPEVSAALEARKHDPAAVAAYGIELAAETCAKILAAGASPGVHIYTLNQDGPTRGILAALGLIDSHASAPLPTRAATRPTPWRPSTAAGRRDAETARPVHWLRRPVAYARRTSKWAPADFAAVAARGFGEAPPYGDGAAEAAAGAAGAAFSAGSPLAVADAKGVRAAFAGMFDGGEVVPWVEPGPGFGARFAAGAPAMGRMAALRGVLVVNEVCRKNGEDSASVAGAGAAGAGWGGSGGRIYQKGYLEFFAPKPLVARLREWVAADAARGGRTWMWSISADAAAPAVSPADAPAASTLMWADFAGAAGAANRRGTVVADAVAFTAWRDEAFAVWGAWAERIGREEEEEKAAGRAAVEAMAGGCELVALADEDVVAGDVWRGVAAVVSSAIEL